MAEPRSKSLSYHRAEYFVADPSSINLGLCIKQATDRLRTVDERTIETRYGQFIRLAGFRADNGPCYYLHLTVETPGGYASVVPRARSQDTELRVGTIPPPNDAEYMDGDAFAFVKGNDVCLCTTTIRAGAVRYFLYKLFEKAQIRRDAREFHFLNAMDAKKVAFLHRRGVKEIELSGVLYKASIDYQKRKDAMVGVLSTVCRHYKAILGHSKDFTDDSLKVLVTLKVDKRRKAGITIGHKRLEELAVNVIEIKTAATNIP